MSEQESNKKSDFIKYCEKASEITNAWPDWKKNLLNHAPYHPWEYLSNIGAPQ